MPRTSRQDVAIVAVVDVLSFTTALTVAIDNGIEVFPFRWRDERAEEFAARHTTPSSRSADPSAGPRQITCPHRPSAPRRACAGSCCPRRTARPSPMTSPNSARTVIGVSLRNMSAPRRLDRPQARRPARCVGRGHRGRRTLAGRGATAGRRGPLGRGRLPRRARRTRLRPALPGSRTPPPAPIPRSPTTSATSCARARAARN